MINFPNVNFATALIHYIRIPHPVSGFFNTVNSFLNDYMAASIFYKLFSFFGRYKYGALCPLHMFMLCQFS